MSESRLQAFDFSGGVWDNLAVETSGGKRLQISLEGETINTTTASPSSGVSDLKPITYLTNSVVDIRSGMFVFAIHNTSSPQYITLNTVKMSWHNPFVLDMSGKNPPRFDFMRITAVSGGGSGIVHVRQDTADSESGIHLTLNHTVLSGCGATDVIQTWNLPQTVSGNVSVWGSETADLANIRIQNTNLLDTSKETKMPIARSGYGFAIRQTTDSGYTQFISGQIMIHTQYTIQ